jgi:tetratricopeptide (TPR) repeat protein
MSLWADNPWSKPLDVHDFRHGKEHGSSSEDGGDDGDDDAAQNAAAPAAAPTAVDAVERRAAGNEHFKKGELEAAYEAYSLALSALVDVPEPDISAMSAVLCNRSAALVKLGRAAEAVQDATDAVQLGWKQVKPYYRLATALYSSGKSREVLLQVVDACDEGLELAPENEQLEELRVSAFNDIRCMADFGRG